MVDKVTVIDEEAPTEAVVDVPQWQPDQVLTEYRKADEAIAKLAEKYGNLVINDIEDGSACKAVIAAHVEVKKYRIAIDKKRKELKKPALQFNNDVEAEAKRLTALIKPLEDKLDAEREKLRAAEKAKKEAEERAEAEKLQLRVEKLQAVNCPINTTELTILPDDLFEQKLKEATSLFRKTEAAQAVCDQLAAFGETVLVSDVIDLSPADHQRRIAEAKVHFEGEQQRLKQAEDDRIEREKAETEERERLRKQNEEQQAEIDRLQKAEADRLAAEEAELKAAQEREAEEARLKRETELKPIREQLQVLAHRVADMDIPLALEFYKLDIRGILDEAADKIGDLAD